MDVTFHETQSYFLSPQSPLQGEKESGEEVLVAFVPFSTERDEGGVVNSRGGNEEGGEKLKEREMEAE